VAYLSMPNPELYRQSIRSSVAIWYTADAYYQGGIVAPGLRPTGGSITDTTAPGVRRTLQLELAPEPGLKDKLAPLGTQLGVQAHVRLADRSVVDIPMGAFDVDVEKIRDGGGGISLTCPDRWAFIQRAQFTRPFSSTPGMQVRDQIVALIRGAIGNAPPININATSGVTVGALTWDQDRGKAIQELATSIGAWVYVDRLGTFTIDNLPTLATAPAVWLADASPSGVLLSLDRESSRARTHNVVVVSSSNASDVGVFTTQVAWDNNPLSPTYAGPDPVNNPTAAGLFGISVYRHETPLALSNTQAFGLALQLVERETALAQQASWSMTPNPAVDSYDVFDVLPLRERYDIPRTVERHVADTATHPLTVGDGSTLNIDARSTRSTDA
jgi:hypothetical protein